MNKNDPENILNKMRLQSAIRLADQYNQSARFEDQKRIYLDILAKFPKNKNAIIGLKKLKDRMSQQKLEVYEPPENELNFIISLYKDTNYFEVLSKVAQLILKYPNSVSLHLLLGAANKGLGRLEDALKAYQKAVLIMPDCADAYYNMGNVFYEEGNLDEAINAYKKCLSIHPEYKNALWNLSSTASSIDEAKVWIARCIKADPEFLIAEFMLSALEYYQGNTQSLNEYAVSRYKDHPHIRSFKWVYKLQKLPSLYFNRWAFFDAVIKLSKADRPFYEFGVWRGAAFKHFIKTFKRGFGFDTFEGLPETWHEVQAGTYTSEGSIPDIPGGEFIVGKFENTLPDFFAEKKPLASIINFDADLYSSTICALNHAKSVIDYHTILIFDELIMNENWEEDELKALEEFCSENSLNYEVIAISFFSKQAAVKLTRI